MSTTPRFHQDQVKDEFDRPIPGSTIYVFSDDNTEAALTSDGFAAIAQPVTTDEFGIYTYWAPEGTYREDIYYGGKLRYRQIIAVGPIGISLFENAAIAADAAANLTSLRDSLSASVAALAIVAAGGLHVDATLMVRPEGYGATGLAADDATVALRAAVGAAAVLGATVQLTPGATYTLTSEVVVPTGVDINGPRSSSLKLKTQKTCVLTSAFTTGTAAKTFTVDDPTGLAVGQTVLFANTATHVVSPNDPFSHAGRQISAIVGNSITIAAGPTVSAHGIGDVMATTSHLVRLAGNNNLRGFTVDGNEANNLYGHWINTAMIAQEGDECRLVGLGIKNTPSDAFLCGGPNGGEIKGSWVLNCDFDNIGGNGCHFGNCRDVFILGNRAKLGNVRFAAPVEQAGGANARLGHQDGFVAISDNVVNVTVANNMGDDWICGVGGLSTSGTNLNDNLSVVGNDWINCYAPIEVIIDTRRVIFANNRCRAALPFNSGSNRWNDHRLTFDGASTVNRIRNIVVTGNIVKNGSIYIDRVKGGIVADNFFDCSEMNTAGNAAATVAVFYRPITLFNYEALTVKGNVAVGGFASLWLQNGFAAGTSYCRDTIIADNIFLNPYRWCLIASLGSTGTLEGTILKGNTFRQDNGATTADGTAMTFNGADWYGPSTAAGLQIESNRIEFNHASGVPWNNVDNPTFMKRRWNTVNGVYELPANYANDAAAAGGGVPIGGFYRNGSAIQQRVA